MIKPSHLSRIDQYWAALIGCQAELLNSKHHTVIVSESSPGVIALHKNAWVIGISKSVKCHKADAIINILDSKSLPLDVERNVHEFLASLGQANVVGPSRLHYLSSHIASPVPSLPYPIRQLSVSHDALVTDFMTNLMVVREYSLHDSVSFPYLLGVFDGNRLAAMGAVRVWGGFIGEVFLDTLPRYVGSGIGFALGLRLVDWILSQPEDMVAQYDTELSNVRSLKVAQKLGFTPYGTILMTNVG
jgi:GNAT superfamily N-acetyltransferase